MAHVCIRAGAIAAASALALAAAGQAQAVSMTAGDTNFEVYGYARLNMSYDVDEDASSTTRAGSFAAINTGDAEDDEITGHFGADAQQSRLGITVDHPSGVMVNVEGDFRGGDLRLRHAYGEYNGILAGQTWSNYNSFVGYTATLDFDSLAGLAGLQGRTAQIRYTTGAFSVAVEDPQSYGGVLNSGGAEKTGLPALTARFESSAGPVSYSVAGLVKQVSLDDGGSVDDDTASGAVFGALTFNVTDSFSLQGVVNYSEGANSYLYRSGEDFGAADAYYDGDSLETISGYGGTVGATFKTSPGSSFNIGYGIVTNDWDDAEDDLGEAAVGDRHETNSNVMVNYQWTPVKNVMYGVEYQYFKVEDVNGDDGDANRVLFAAQYGF